MTMADPGTTTCTIVSDDEVVLTRVFDAPRRLVFAAFTEPAHLPNWLTGPDGWSMPVCEVDLRTGGAWRFGWRHENGEVLEMRGVYLEIVPPERLVNTERWGEEWPETVNTLVLTEADGRTTMEQHIRYPSKADRDAALATGMANGASISYENLARLLATMDG